MHTAGRHAQACMAAPSLVTGRRASPACAYCDEPCVWSSHAQEAHAGLRALSPHASQGKPLPRRLWAAVVAVWCRVPLPGQPCPGLPRSRQRTFLQQAQDCGNHLHHSLQQCAPPLASTAGHCHGLSAWQALGSLVGNRLAPVPAQAALSPQTEGNDSSHPTPPVAEVSSHVCIPHGPGPGSRAESAIWQVPC